MTHFSPSDWVDSVRGLLPAERGSNLKSHLDQQCPECTKAFAFWGLIADLLAQEKRYRPPERVLQTVERSYLEHKPWRWLETAARWAERVFDTLQQPSPAFVRGAAPPDRHLVYEAKPFVVDVTLKTNPNQNSLSMLGQVLNSDHPERAPAEVHVVLLSGGDLIAKAIAGDGGEFEIACEARANLTLFISIRGERAIGLSLYDSTENEDAPNGLRKPS